MRKLRHKNVVVIYDHQMERNHLLLLLEKREDGTLCDLIRVRRWLSLGEVSHLARQAYQGLAYIHKMDIVHR